MSIVNIHLWKYQDNQIKTKHYNGKKKFCFPKTKQKCDSFIYQDSFISLRTVAD